MPAGITAGLTRRRNLPTAVTDETGSATLSLQNSTSASQRWRLLRITVSAPASDCAGTCTVYIGTEIPPIEQDYDSISYNATSDTWNPSSGDSFVFAGETLTLQFANLTPGVNVYARILYRPESELAPSENQDPTITEWGR